MDEGSKLLLEKKIYSTEEETNALLKKNTNVLMVSCGDVDDMRNQRFLFNFRCSGNSGGTLPLRLGSMNASCGEFVNYRSGDGIRFNELGFLNDPLSKMLSIHLLQQLREINLATQDHIYCMAASFMSYLVNRYKDSQVNEGNKKRVAIPNFTLRRIEEYVQRNIAKPIHVSELSKIAGSSIFYFVRMFKECTGETPYQYITRCKVEKAQRLLTTTQQKIIQIGFEVGFNDPGHFARVYKKSTGISPTKYRKMMRA